MGYPTKAVKRIVIQPLHISDRLYPQYRSKPEPILGHFQRRNDHLFLNGGDWSDFDRF